MNGMQPDHQPRPFPGDEANFKGSRIETAPVEADTEANGHATNGQGDDEIPYEERAQFAGVEADDDDQLVTTDELIEAPSSAADRGVENSPLTRLAFVGSALGAIALIIWIFSGFFTGGNQQAQESEAESPLPAESASTFGEDDRMRAELALIEQARSQPEQRLAETPQRPTSETEEETPADTAPPTTTPTRVSRPTPAPTPARPAATPPPEPAASRTVRPSSVAAEAEAEAVDPLEQWSRLSEAGAAGAEVALVPEPEIDAPIEAEAQTARATPISDRLESGSDSEALPFPSATVGDDPVPLPDEGGISNKEAAPVAQRNSNAEVQLASSSPGAAGIIQQRPVTASEAAETAQLQQVAIGESAPGTVIVPVVYAGGEVSARGRFAIELTEPLRDINGEVALAAGTVLITQLTEILDANILRQQVVAIVYRDDQGQVRQEALEPGVLMVRGEDNRPLVAQVRNDDSGSDFGDDVLVGALSALGNIGAVLNAPDAVTTATSEAAGGTSSTSTTTTVTSGQDDDVVAAALEGFFTPVSERVAERFEQQSQNTSDPYLFVPEGQAVSVFVNGVLEVAQ
ncbi:hypothetical protein [Halomicronema sp. CCY15110]|uniref:hypothetical protein n=1 Tax=Halomicronema sp. CCY15110 TaxID=2767773 RepID=UPI001950F2E5|nr:hypothetical protein [Halomicronema sp. CCY15110]